MSRPDRSSWIKSLTVGLTLGFVAAIAGSWSFAQDPKADEAASQKAADEPKAEPAPAVTAEELEERYRDPSIDPLLENTFTELYPTVRASGLTDSQIDAMASGSQAANAAQITQYIQAQLSVLTRHGNLDAVRDPSGQANLVAEYDQAGQRLIRPLNIANERNNTAFRSAFTTALMAEADQVLQNHLNARLSYMVALSRSGDPALIPLFARILRDENQPAAVKMLATVGIARIAGDGTIDVLPAQGMEAASAIADFLRTDQPDFWPIQARAVQAIGAVKQPASNPVDPTPDLAAVVMGYLADPAGQEQVRAWAAWALGLLRPSTQVSEYNYHLVAHHIGRAAAAIGSQIVRNDATNSELTTRLAGLLLQTVIAFEGNPAIRNSGLLQATHPALNAQRSQIDAIHAQVRTVARAAVELNQAVGRLRDPARQELAKSVLSLVAELEKTPPAQDLLYPNGPAFPANTPVLPAAERAAVEAASLDEVDSKVSKAVERAKSATPKKAAAGAP